MGLHLMSGRKSRVRGWTTKFGSFTAPLAVRRLSARKGVVRLEEFLIFTNRNCLFLVSLREGNKLLRRSDLILSACPECNHKWSVSCPFFVQLLNVVWHSKVP